MGLTVTSGAPATATDEIAPDQNGNVRFVLKDRRPVTFRKVPLSRRLKILSLLGEDGANPAISSMVLIACSVTELAGEVASPPLTRLQIDAILDRLEDDAISEVGTHYLRLFGSAPIEGEALGN